MAWIEALDTAVYFKATGPSDGRPVLLLHELGGTSSSWQGLIEQLRDCYCVAIDLPGSGRSEKRRGNSSIGELAAVTREVMRTLLPDRKWHLVGSALGSFVALELAHGNPELVASMVVCAAVPSIDAKTGAYLRERVKRIEREGMAAATEASLANSLTPDLPLPLESVRRNYRYAFRCQDPDAYGRLSLALADFQGGVDYLSGISTPTLVMSGRHDFIWPPPAVETLASAIPGCQFHVLEDGGHFAHLQCPQSFAERMTTFWNELPGG